MTYQETLIDLTTRTRLMLMWELLGRGLLVVL